MNRSKLVRSTKIKEDPDANAKNISNSSVPLRKIFYISQQMLTKEEENLKLERFYHPGKGRLALFITKENKHMMEILEFAEPRRSWLIDNEVCSNGHIYITTPLDVTFMALYHLRKHCFKRALALDSIHDEEDPSLAKLLNTFVNPVNLNCISDIKTVDENMFFYKYNNSKALSWLSLKTKKVAKALQTGGVYCGNSAISQNFTKSEKALDETAKDGDYLRMACDYVGGYIALDLHEELRTYLKIPSEIHAITEQKKVAAKRKMSDKRNLAKKQKLENESPAKLTNKLLDESLDEERNNWDNEENKGNTSIIEETKLKSSPVVTATPLKERSLSAKEKSLAKSAKGTKCISSFFTKKTA